MSDLRRIIRESIEEQGWTPGRWYPASGEPVDPDDVALMGTGGLGHEEHEEEDDLNEAALTVKGLKKVSLDDVRSKFPKFVDILTRKFGEKDVSKASFALSPQGFLGLGGKVPLMATQDYNDPVVYWEDDLLKYNGSSSLADAVRDAQ